MKTTVTLSLHENYVNVVVRFYKQTSMSYVQHSLCGADVVNYIKESWSIRELRRSIETCEEEPRDIRGSYLDGFKGHFSITYKLINDEDVTEFEVVESRLINPSRGGRSVSGGFNNKLLGKKIFMNLLNASAARDVDKLNGIMSALYSVGG